METTQEQRKAIRALDRVSQPASVARAVNAIEAFEKDGFPEGMGERLVYALEEAYVSRRRV